MASNRNPIVAVVMAIIPFVNIFLIYSWWNELKKAGKTDKDPIMWTVLSIVPIINLYAIYVLFQTAEDVAKKNNKAGYPIGALPLYGIGIIASFFMIGILVLLFQIYKTQEIFNENGI